MVTKPLLNIFLTVCPPCDWIMNGTGCSKIAMLNLEKYKIKTLFQTGLRRHFLFLVSILAMFELEV